MRHTVPVEHLLLLLRPNAVVLVQKIQETTFRLFERGICAGLEIAQVRENALLEFLGILHWPPEGLKSEREASDNVRAGNVKEIVPRNNGLAHMNPLSDEQDKHTIARKKRIHRLEEENVEYTGLVSSRREQILKSISLHSTISNTKMGGYY